MATRLRRHAPPSASDMAPRRPVRRWSKATAILVVAACCLGSFSFAEAQDAGVGAGSSAGSGGTSGGAGTVPVTISPVVTPTSTPATTTDTPAPVATTEQPAATTKTPATTAPTPTTETPAPTTETPTETPKATVAVSNTTDATTAAEATTAPAATVESTTAPVSSSSSSSSQSAASPASTPSGASYGTKSSADSSNSKEATTKSSADSSKTAIQFVAVAAGVLAVVLAVAMSVHFHQKRRTLDKESGLDDDEKFFNSGPKRPTMLDMNDPATTKAAAPAASTTYDNYSTPQAAMPGWGHATAGLTKPVPPPAPASGVSAYHDSGNFLAATGASSAAAKESTTPGIVMTAATTGSAATFVGRNRGENDVDGGEAMAPLPPPPPPVSDTEVSFDEDFRSPRTEQRVTVKQITKYRGNSEDFGNESLSQYGQGLLATTFDTDEGYSNSQMFAFSDSGSEDGSHSMRSGDGRGTNGGATSDVSEFLKYYPGEEIGKPSVEVDVDADYDDEDFIGRSTRSSSLLDGSVRESDFTVDNRTSTSSSIMEFHDSTVDRFSELDSEEFEV